MFLLKYKDKLLPILPPPQKKIPVHATEIELLSSFTLKSIWQKGQVAQIKFFLFTKFIIWQDSNKLAIVNGNYRIPTSDSR